MLAGLLPQITVPVTLISGRHDHVVPLANADGPKAAARPAAIAKSRIDVVSTFAPAASPYEESTDPGPYPLFCIYRDRDRLQGFTSTD